MNAFKRKALTVAVLAGMSAAGAAHAVFQDPNGQGQVLLYPYYTVQSSGGNAYNTYISVVNTTNVVKVVKVRFREGKASAEVLDFNLYLSPNDVWTGAVVPASTDAAAPGRLVTGDVSCTNPAIPSTGVDFRNFIYANDYSDIAGTGLDRTREGYVEMIEMATMDPAKAPGNAAVHTASGAPTCTGLRGTNLIANATFAGGLLAPTGGLNGTGTLINVNNGADAGYNARALSNMTAAQIYADIGNNTPNWADADPQSAVIANNNAYYSDWTLSAFPGVYAVGATMTHSNVINEYVLDSATLSNTDWVMTFPTKWALVDDVAVNPPFTELFTKNGACEEISFTYFNREERGATAADTDFSPLPPPGAASGLCWESTVLSIRNGATHMPTGSTSGPLGSVNYSSVNVTSTFQNGWANMSFTGANAVAGIASDAASITTPISTGVGAAGSQTFSGLPVMGFMVRTFNNGTLTCGTASCQGTYGSAFDHKFQQTIVP